MLPFLHLFGMEIPMYGLCMSLAIAVAVVLCCVRTRLHGCNWEEIMTIACFAVICGLLGAKILYIAVTYTPREMAEQIRSNGLFGFFANTGLVFYGALIGGIGGAFLAAAVSKIRIVDHVDAIVPTLPLAHAIGRMGCFCAGCCYGKVTDSWIGMCFPDSVSGELLPTVKVIPTQLIESGANLLVFAALMLITRRKRKGYTSLFIYLMIYAVERFIIEFLRGDEIRGVYGLFSTSQWISIVLFFLALAGIFATQLYYQNRPLAPGRVFAGKLYREILELNKQGMTGEMHELEYELLDSILNDPDCRSAKSEADGDKAPEPAEADVTDAKRADDPEEPSQQK